MPDSFKLHMQRWGWVVLGIIFFDQVTKILADHYLNYRQPISVFPLFNLTLVYNPGAAFSFLSDAGGWQRWFFIMLSSVISIVLFIWLLKLKPEQKLQTVSIAMILGGAIGNLIDRSIYGHVIDFLDVYFQQHHWPAFNVADSAITVGAILLIIDSFKNRHDN